MGKIEAHSLKIKMMASYLHYLATNRCTKGFESGHWTILLLRKISVKSQLFKILSVFTFFLKLLRRWWRHCNRKIGASGEARVWPRGGFGTPRMPRGRMGPIFEITTSKIPKTLAKKIVWFCSIRFSLPPICLLLKSLLCFHIIAVEKCQIHELQGSFSCVGKSHFDNSECNLLQKTSKQ